MAPSSKLLGLSILFLVSSFHFLVVLYLPTLYTTTWERRYTFLRLAYINLFFHFASRQQTDSGAGWQTQGYLGWENKKAHVSAESDCQVKKLWCVEIWRYVSSWHSGHKWRPFFQRERCVWDLGLQRPLSCPVDKSKTSVQIRFEIIERYTDFLCHPLTSQCGKGCIHFRGWSVSTNIFQLSQGSRKFQVLGIQRSTPLHPQDEWIQIADPQERDDGEKKSLLEVGMVSTLTCN